MNAPRRTPRRHIDGVLLLDKPIGLSSNAALQQMKRLYRAEKAGHTGTLDPLASGLLPICFGEATKFAHMLLDADKTYCAVVRFGTTTTTGDAEGDVIEERPVRITADHMLAVLPRFVGRIAQVPPRYAALKYRGRNYYEYAREGVEIPRVAREVVIHTLALETWSAPDAQLTLCCGKGTYVRALAEDLGAALGCGAHLAALRRIATGGFDVASAHTVDALTALGDVERDARLLGVDVLVSALSRLELDAAESSRFAHGQMIRRAAIADGAYRAYADGVFRGVAHASAGTVQPKRLMSTPKAPGAT